MLHKAFIWLYRTIAIATLIPMLRAAWLMAGKEGGMGYVVLVSAILVALLVVICFIYLLRTKPDDPATDDALMSLALRRILISYFLLSGALFVALLVDLNMVDFPETAVSIPITSMPTPSPTPAATPAATPASTPAGQPGTGNSASSDGSAKISPEKSGDPMIIQVIP